VKRNVSKQQWSERVKWKNEKESQRHRGKTFKGPGSRKKKKSGAVTKKRGQILGRKGGRKNIPRHGLSTGRGRCRNGIGENTTSKEKTRRVTDARRRGKGVLMRHVTSPGNVASPWKKKNGAKETRRKKKSTRGFG